MFRDAAASTWPRLAYLLWVLGIIIKWNGWQSRGNRVKNSLGKVTLDHKMWPCLYEDAFVRKKAFHSWSFRKGPTVPFNCKFECECGPIRNAFQFIVVPCFASQEKTSTKNGEKGHGLFFGWHLCEKVELFMTETLFSHDSCLQLLSTGTTLNFVVARSSVAIHTGPRVSLPLDGSLGLSRNLITRGLLDHVFRFRFRISPANRRTLNDLNNRRGCRHFVSSKEVNSAKKVTADVARQDWSFSARNYYLTSVKIDQDVISEKKSRPRNREHERAPHFGSPIEWGKLKWTSQCLRRNSTKAKHISNKIG